jgi:hypothetical protein
MAVLSNGDRQIVTNRLMLWLSENRITLTAHLKADVRAAVDATDTWQDDNASSFNNALPTATKNNATASQKARIFDEVSKRRREVA